MTKLKSSSIDRLSDDSKVEEYYKEAALDALLYWANSTSQLAGNNVTMTILTEMLATCIANMVPENQVDRARTTIYGLLDEAFDLIGESSPAPDKSSDLN
jgi:hypothetical protein